LAQLDKNELHPKLFDRDNNNNNDNCNSNNSTAAKGMLEIMKF
jgi:hypothetical protein